MDIWSKKACRLCLKLIYNNFAPINAIATQMLDVVLLKPNLKVSPEPVMCNECGRNLKKFFDFKMTILNRQTSLMPLINHKETIVQALSSSEYRNVKCQFCMEFATQENLIGLFKTNDNICLVHLLKKHISGVNIFESEEYLTCGCCVEYLQNIFNFIWKYLDVEDKIRKYVEINRIELKDQIELCNVQMYTVNPIKDEISDIAVDEANIKQTCSKEEKITMECELKIEDIVEEDVPTLYVKMEEIEAEIRGTDDERYNLSNITHVKRTLRNPERLVGRHFPAIVPNNKVRRCSVCSKTKTRQKKKRRESRYMCSECNVGLCIHPCFGIFHTKEIY